MTSIPRKSRGRPNPSPDPPGAAYGLYARRRTLAFAGLAQLAGAFIALGIALFSRAALGFALPPTGVALGAGVAAAAIGVFVRLPPWWRVIHLVLPFLALGALALAPDPAWYLGAFIATVLVFRAAPADGVPLYLSSSAEIDALGTLVPGAAALRVLDAGCGTGSVLAGLARRRPQARLEGIESSLLPWVVARLRSAVRARFGVKWGSLWRADFGAYDLVYAFLSPAPMSRLWEKARREMRPGTLLVSNRFPVPGVAPTLAVPTGPGGRCLYVWRM